VALRKARGDDTAELNGNRRGDRQLRGDLCISSLSYQSAKSASVAGGELVGREWQTDNPHMFVFKTLSFNNEKLVCVCMCQHDNIVVVVWKGCDTAKTLPGLHHGDQAFRQANTLYLTIYNLDLPGRGQRLLVNKVAQ
jgi:hypothetical protein